MDRIGKVINSLRVDDLNTPQKDLVLGWAKYFADIFRPLG